MTAGEFVSSHTRVKHPRSNIAVTISVCEDKDDELCLEFTPDEIINGDYKHCIVKEWYQTSESTNNGMLIDISILI